MADEKKGTESARGKNRRKERKDEHIEQYLQTSYSGDSLLDEVYLEPVSLPELSLAEIDSRLSFLGRTIPFPFMINAMTGGTETTRAINQSLARLARKAGVPLQLGSMRIALEDASSLDSFRVARDEMGKEGILLANIGPDATVEEVATIMEAIEADGVGIHLNAHQEAVQEEGQRDFRGWKARLKEIAQAFPGKVIVKQVGLGMDVATLRFLNDLPLAYVDISGTGGTNFFEIEDLRLLSEDFTEFYGWGIPTAQAILSGRTHCPRQALIASGGVRTATDLLHALVLGARMGAGSGELLRFLLNGNEAYADQYLTELQAHFRLAMAFMACRTLEELPRLPHRLLGRLGELQTAPLRGSLPE